MTLSDYLQLDESVIYFYFQRWQHEEDAILRDLCCRFMERKLFKYVEIEPENEAEKIERLKELLQNAGIDPTYYLVVDSSTDLPYDVYRSGGGRVPIYLQMPSGEERELSTHSVIVDAISGKKREDHKLYYPAELVEVIKDSDVKTEICELLNRR